MSTLSPGLVLDEWVLTRRLINRELKVVNIWFQNKRQTTKRKMLEMGEIEKGESPFENTNKEPVRRQPSRQSVLKRPSLLSRRHTTW